jgi:hypothetical protein
VSKDYFVIVHMTARIKAGSKHKLRIELDLAS